MSVAGPPRVLGDRYELLDPLGRGGMGEVWTARDRRLDRLVAVKMVRSPDLDERSRNRFVVEARAAARLNHPNVVTVYDAGEDDGVPYLVMELLPGRTLADEIARGPMDGARVERLARELLSALEASHRAGVLHRDIKPANVLLGHDGTARLADFGIAKSVDDEDATATGVVLGSLAYLAPERFAGGGATERSDLWAVGAVLYEALTTRTPLATTHPLAVSPAAGPTFPSLRALRPGLDPALAASIERALAIDPADRFASAAEMARALDGTRSVAAAAPTAVTTAATPVERLEATRPLPRNGTTGRVSPSPRRRPRLAPVIVAVAGVLVVVALVVLSARRSPPADQAPPPTTATTDPTSPLPEALDDALTALEEAVRP